MKMVPYTNNTSGMVTVGGRSVLPGETRMVDKLCMPPIPPKRFDPTELLALTVKEITPVLPSLDPDELALLLDSEQSAQHPRKSLIESISQAILDLELAMAIKEFSDSLAECTGEQLEEKLLEFRNDSDRLAAIESEKAKRA